MKQLHLAVIVAGLCLTPLAAPSVVRAQSADTFNTFIQMSKGYRVVPNVTYVTVSNTDVKLDVYTPTQGGPNPTLIFMHGGGWFSGTKDASLMAFLPYLQMGWSVVNVEYRLNKVALAPAAVEDCRCALRWVYRNAKEYNFDLNKIVLMGQSAGSHLALMTGMLPVSAGLDNQCPRSTGEMAENGATTVKEMKVAAILDWYGISDVAEMLEGPNMRVWTLEWLGSRFDRREEAKRMSPLTYVRSGLPPMVIIHGDADPYVPYTQAVRLHEALDKVGVPNEFVTIPGGGHGNYSVPETLRAYGVIRAFLAKHGITKSSAATQ